MPLVPLTDIKIVVIDNLHKTLIDYINEKEVIIGNYDDMVETVLNMIKARHCFNVDRERLRDAMEDITFMLCLWCGKPWYDIFT